MAKGPVAETLGRAEALSDAGEYEAALEQVEEALRDDPENAAGHTARGWALENLGADRLIEARDAYVEALRLDPTALWAKEGLSNVLRRLGQAEDANRLAQEVIEEGRTRCYEEVDLLELIGWCQHRLGMHEEAAKTLREALDTDGRWVPVRFDMALAMLCAGDRVKAFLEYQRGVQQALNWGLARTRGHVIVAMDDLEETLGERPGLAASREAMAARELLRSTLRADARAG